MAIFCLQVAVWFGPFKEANPFPIKWCWFWCIKIELALKIALQIGANHFIAQKLAKLWILGNLHNPYENFENMQILWRSSACFNIYLSNDSNFFTDYPTTKHYITSTSLPVRPWPLVKKINIASWIFLPGLFRLA